MKGLVAKFLRTGIAAEANPRTAFSARLGASALEGTVKPNE
jgi:hypothetical protein